MALSIDTSPLRRFLESVSTGETPASWAWQAGVAALAIFLGWAVARVVCRRFQVSPRWRFGAGDFERVAWPIFAYVVLVIGRAILVNYQAVIVLDILAIVLMAWIAIRFAVYILGLVMPEGAFLRATVRLVAWVAWFAVILKVTGLLPEVIQTLDEIGFGGGKDSQRISLWLILQGVASLAITLTVALWITRIVAGRVMASETVDMSTRVVVTKAVNVTAVFLAVLVALPLVGIDVTVLSVFGGALGVGLGFGLQKIAANYVSGFIVLLDRGLRIGDIVTIDGKRGQVREIASRYTVVRSGDGSELIVPNEKLITEVVSHHTYSDRQGWIVLAVGVAYGTDVDRACALLLEVAGRQARVLLTPPALARVTSLGESAVNLELTVWIAETGSEGELRDLLYRDLLRTFRGAGIEIPFPRRDVYQIPTLEIPETAHKSTP